MNSINRLLKIAGGIVFIISSVIYIMSAERTGSLWDCGEFILGAYKLQIVHPPGAPFFLLVGRIFAFLGEIFGSTPASIAYAVNIMSALCSGAAATFVGWSTLRLSSLLFGDRNNQVYDTGASIALIGSGVVAGLATAFSSSIWFSAVEGEVYAMSTMFTALTVWTIVKWYTLPKENDKWIIAAAYGAGLSIGVHLLSMLTFPGLAILIYLRKSKKTSLLGILGATVIGAATVPIIQKLIITGLPSLWKTFELMLVNGIGMPFHSGLIPTLLIAGGAIYFVLAQAKKRRSRVIELVALSGFMMIIGYSTFGTIPIRSNADTPVNMNVPSDVTRLLPYLNREQYGERPIMYGPHYEASPVRYDREEREGRVTFPPHYEATPADKYEVVDEKIRPIYKNSDKILFPRIAHAEMGRPNLYRQWYGHIFNGEPKPSFAFNIGFFLKYQIGWVYTRYFMWNFVGKQNAEQGFSPWNKSDGHWASGIKFIDESKLYNMDELPDSMKNHKGTNSYYFLPLIFGLIGFVFHALRSKNEFYALVILFLVTGIGIIIYTNSPPNEPRERDYVFIGSFFTFCMWIGMAVPAIYLLIKEKVATIGSVPAAALASVLVLSAPMIMGFQNYDDHSRAGITASRDYANNFLSSVAPNAIIFTYGDNDTYPLWYAQEVENVRPDVRIVNLSLIAVDWYINKLRRKVNDSEPIKLTVSAEAYRGNKRNQLPFFDGGRGEKPLNWLEALKFIGGKNPVGASTMNFESYVPSHELVLPTNAEAAVRLGMWNPADSLPLEREIRLKFAESKSWITKDDLAVMDVIASNIWERPIYFATTCKNEKLLGLNDYMQYEGLALRVVPIKTKSDRSLSIYGSGRVDADLVYENVMNKFKWGGFDKQSLFVDNSYGAAVQAHRMVISRAAEKLLSEGDRERAIKLVLKYFEGFPNMNFPYDASTASFVNILVRAGALDQAKEHLRILANEISQYLKFYASIDPDTVQSSFSQDMAFRQRTVGTILSLAQAMKDEAFTKEMQDLVGQFQARSVPN